MIGTIRRPSWTGLAGLALAAVLAFTTAAPPAAAAPEGTVTVTGTVTRVQASQRAVTVQLSEGGESRFLWTDDTRITGVLTPGARVTVRYVVEDGQNRALQITVARS
jgi:outer membrane receptor protein involved in Fe transport